MAMCMKSVRSIRAARPARAAVKVQASAAANMAKAAGLGLASLGLALSANAAQVIMGADSGELVFTPSTLSIPAGSTVDFVNNVGGPHNAVFDDEAVPEGVDTDLLNFEPLNAKGDKVTLKFDTPGTYVYYCQPHNASGMKGVITVQ